MLASTAAPAFAQDVRLGVNASASVRAEFKEERQEQREEKKEQREEVREERASKSQEFRSELKERLSSLRKERIKKWWTKAARRLSQLIDRQNRLADRVETRIERLEDAGKDVSAQRTALAAARLKIDASAAALASASAQVDVVISDNTPAEAFRKLHELHKGVISKIREAHYALVRVVVSLKGMSGASTP